MNAQHCHLEHWPGTGSYKALGSLCLAVAVYVDSSYGYICTPPHIRMHSIAARCHASSLCVNNSPPLLFLDNSFLIRGLCYALVSLLVFCSVHLRIEHTGNLLFCLAFCTDWPFSPQSSNLDRILSKTQASQSF